MAKRRSVKFDDEMLELFKKARERIRLGFNGYCPADAHVQQEAMRMGLMVLAAADANCGTLKLPGALCSSLVRFESKKEPKKVYITSPTDPGKAAAENQPEHTQLMERYADRQLVADTLTAVATTRARGKMAQSVVNGILQKLAQHPVDVVQAACQVYLDKGCAAEGKGENYLIGIVRQQGKQDGQLPVPTAPPGNGAQVPPGYPKDLYNGKRWFWSEQARGWYPVNQYGKPDFSARSWPFKEGMRKP